MGACGAAELSLHLHLLVVRVHLHLHLLQLLLAKQLFVVSIVVLLGC